MIEFNDLQVGQTVYIHQDWTNNLDEWLAVTVKTLIGDRQPNPGRTLVEVTSPWIEEGWAVMDIEDLYPAPSFNTTYK